MNTTFYSLHPAVSFLFFCTALALTMLCMHPVFAVISLAAALLFAACIKGNQMKSALRFALPLFLLISLLNPVFNHRGDTVLFFVLEQGITLEAVQYGLCSGVMFAAVVVWFSGYSAVITSDKFLYLFGRIMPSAALVISMAVRLVPKMRGQLETIGQAQRMLDVGRKAKLISRIRSGLHTLSVLLSWTMEDAIETADSMKARGYGMHRRRTNFSLFRMDGRDTAVLGFVLILSLAVWALFFGGYATLYFYPVMRPVGTDAFSLAGYAAYALLMLTPTLLQWKENITWRKLRSTI
jgi:energy-coupling factor transport system permease protein